MNPSFATAKHHRTWMRCSSPCCHRGHGQSPSPSFPVENQKKAKTNPSGFYWGVPTMCVYVFVRLTSLLVFLGCIRLCYYYYNICCVVLSSHTFDSVEAATHKQKNVACCFHTKQMCIYDVIHILYL